MDTPFRMVTVTAPVSGTGGEPRTQNAEPRPRAGWCPLYLRGGVELGLWPANS